MNFDRSVPDIDRAKITQALSDIRRIGTVLQATIARFIEESEIIVSIDPASSVGGSGSVAIDRVIAVNRAIARGELSVFEAAAFVRLKIARETIDTGGQRGIEGTLVHEGKHAMDFARMIAGFSSGDERNFFDPTAFQREYSAHLTSAFYLKRRGGEYAEEGIGLGILYDNGGGNLTVNRKGIRARLRNNYGLTPEKPGKRLSEMSFPNVAPRGGSIIWRFF